MNTSPPASDPSVNDQRVAALAEFIKQSIAEAQAATAHLPKPIASVYVSKAGMSIDICLDNSRDTYSDWIAGEGADVGLIRDQETHKVVGAHLPLYAKSLVVCGEVLPTLQFDLETGKPSPAPAAEPSGGWELPDSVGFWIRGTWETGGTPIIVVRDGEKHHARPGRLKATFPSGARCEINWLTKGHWHKAGDGEARAGEGECFWVTTAEFQSLRKLLPGQPETPSHVFERLPKHVATLEADLAAAKERITALGKIAAEHATKRGEAEGILAASEMAGTVQGWKERAVKAEAERDAALAQVRELRVRADILDESFTNQSAAIDALREHFDVNGNLRGNGEWRASQIVKHFAEAEKAWRSGVDRLAAATSLSAPQPPLAGQGGWIAGDDVTPMPEGRWLQFHPHSSVLYIIVPYMDEKFRKGLLYIDANKFMPSIEPPRYSPGEPAEQGGANG